MPEPACLWSWKDRPKHELQCEGAATRALGTRSSRGGAMMMYGFKASAFEVVSIYCLRAAAPPI